MIVDAPAGDIRRRARHYAIARALDRLASGWAAEGDAALADFCLALGAAHHRAAEDLPVGPAEWARLAREAEALDLVEELEAVAKIADLAADLACLFYTPSDPERLQ